MIMKLKKKTVNSLIYYNCFKYLKSLLSIQYNVTRKLWREEIGRDARGEAEDVLGGRRCLGWRLVASACLEMWQNRLITLG